MRHQLLDGDSLFAVLAELGNVQRYRIGEGNLSSLDEDHNRRSSRNDLCQRCQIEDRIDSQRLAIRLNSAIAESLAINDAASSSYKYNRARSLFAFDRRKHCFIDLREPLAR